MHKLTDTDLDQAIAENHPGAGLTCLERETHAHPCD